MAQESLLGKVAIVSGSAKGIGAAICVELASKGAKVVVNYPWPSELKDAESVLQRIRDSGSSSAKSCIAVEADISTLTGPESLVRQAVQHFGNRIDILVNNAGMAIMEPLPDISLKSWDFLVNLNARGLLLLTQAALPHLANPGRIVNTSSVGARQGVAGSTVYNATKSMVESFTRCWAVELGRKGCTVNAICPGPTNTHGFASQKDPSFLQDILPSLQNIPVAPRLAEPEEIAFAVGFLCEPRASWITGVCIGVNGGFHMA